MVHSSAYIASVEIRKLKQIRRCWNPILFTSIKKLWWRLLLKKCMLKTGTTRKSLCWNLFGLMIRLYLVKLWLIWRITQSVQNANFCLLTCRKVNSQRPWSTFIWQRCRWLALSGDRPSDRELDLSTWQLTRRICNQPATPTLRISTMSDSNMQRSKTGQIRSL